MKSLAAIVLVACVLCACGCRHTYEPAPPAYYCQPACGCAPACAPTYNQCAPSNTPYLQPSPTTIPRTIPPYSSGAATGTYAPPAGGAYGTPGSNTNPSLPPAR
jgi:hypothetical protein